MSPMKAMKLLLISFALAGLSVGCKTRNTPPPVQEPAEVPPADYAQPGDTVPNPPPGDQQGGRFRLCR